jgi:hypothetical protein
MFTSDSIENGIWVLEQFPVQFPTTRHLADEFQRIIEKQFAAYSWVVALFGFLVIIPLSLWFIWRDSSAFIYKMAETAVCLSWGWTMVSLLQMFRIFREVGLTPEGRLQLLSGPRPNDPDELRVWRSAWRFMFACIATILSMVAIPVADSLTKK